MSSFPRRSLHSPFCHLEISAEASKKKIMEFSVTYGMQLLMVALFLVIPITLLLCLATALCGYPIVKIEIRDSSQTSTTAPIFLLSNYFRQKYLEIASCAVSLLNDIWVRVDHSLLQQLNLQKVNCSSSSLQAGCE